MCHKFLYRVVSLKFHGGLSIDDPDMPDKSKARLAVHAAAHE
jgi:hypothetical protein